MIDTPRTDRWIKNCNGWHHVSAERSRELERELAAANERNLNLRWAIAKSQEEITQICGKALGYPWYKDDQKNFPGSDETDGVCVGEHVAETIVAELADKYAKANERIKRLERAIQRLVESPDNRSLEDFTPEELEAWANAKAVLENKE